MEVDDWSMGLHGSEMGWNGEWKKRKEMRWGGIKWGRSHAFNLMTLVCHFVESH